LILFFTVLDVITRIENLERENDSLKKDLDKLKTQLSPENWEELILYRPIDEDNNTPVEITWQEEDTVKKQGYYRTEEPMRRKVIGLVRKAQS